MKTPNLDKEINRLKWLNKARDLSSEGEEILIEYKLIKEQITKLKNNGDLGGVTNTYKPNCSECGDRGWIYNEHGSKNRICACHY